MNKIKIIYDAVKKMKDRGCVKGTFKADGTRDQTEILNIRSEFEKNSAEGKLKGKTNIEADCDGKKIKLEKSINFEGECCKDHSFGRHMHGFHKHHHCFAGNMHEFGNNQDMKHPFGLKDGMDKISSVLGILSSINIDEMQDGSAVLSLKSADIPEDIRKCIYEKMKQKHEFHKAMADGHECHKIMKEFHAMDNADFVFSIYITKDKEIDSITVELSGLCEDEKGEKHDVKLKAEMKFE